MALVPTNLMRITLIHALRPSIDPIQEAFARLWPEAELRNVLDDSLSGTLPVAPIHVGHYIDHVHARVLQ